MCTGNLTANNFIGRTVGYALPGMARPGVGDLTNGGAKIGSTPNLAQQKTIADEPPEPKARAKFPGVRGSLLTSNAAPGGGSLLGGYGVSR